MRIQNVSPLNPFYELVSLVFLAVFTSSLTPTGAEKDAANIFNVSKIQILSYE